jgi:hypothetical protein
VESEGRPRLTRLTRSCNYLPVRKRRNLLEVNLVRAIVGGRPFDFTKEEIERRMRGVQPEPIREHLVEMLSTVYPPKQVLATVSGWDRTSFTTLEAQRVLTRAGFVCRRAGDEDDYRRGRFLEQPTDDDAESEADAERPDARLARLEAALTVAQEAIAFLVGRVEQLESSAGAHGDAAPAPGSEASEGREGHMSKYDPLRDFLTARAENTVTLTFSEIDELVGTLPPSARKYDLWWLNRDPSHRHCQSWGEAGYTAHPDLRGGQVTFCYAGK